MPASINIVKIIELKRILSEKFGIELHMHDTCSGQYFSLENSTPDGIDYIKNYFETKKYVVFFNEENTEFYIEDMRIC